MKKVDLFFLMLLLHLPVLALSQITVEEYLGMENIASLQVYESKILYSKTTKERWEGKTFSSIIVTDLNGNGKLELTSNHYDFDPKFSPNGKWIAFVSYRDNKQQIYIIPSSDGKPKIASDAQSYISNYKWLDDESIAYVDDEPQDSLWRNTEKKNGGGYWVGTEFYTNAVWTYNIKTEQKKKVTDGTFRVIDFDISKNGKQLAILGAKNYDTYESITNSWVKVIEMEHESPVYEFKEANSLNNLKFSPSGTQLAFVGSTTGFAANDGLYYADLKTGTTKNLTYDFDPTIERIQWIDERNLSFSTSKNGYTGIYSVNVNGKIKTVMEPVWVIYDYQLIGNQLFFTASRGSKTKQLYKLIFNDKQGNALPLTDLNEELTPKIKTTSSILDYVSKDDTKVHGIITYPPNYDNSKRYPLMTIPHGGPDAVVMDDFNWMGQFFADNGYVVFQPNFRGSIGYGRDFYAGNRNAFGQTDFEDIMAGIDKLIEIGIADEEKLVIGGWSYGGYMANWVITQTNRFKASISVAGVSNLVSLYGQHEFSNRDIGLWEYKSLLIDNPENYRKASPIFFVKNIKTPLLILHGADDTRSPTLQAWEMYRAMKDANKEVAMMIYPGAGHGIQNPAQFKSVLNNWLKWANEHIVE